VFVSLEGIDGSGKSTQAKLLAEALGPETLLVREPGGTDAAERIRELLADRDLELDPLAELLLFCAARADLVRRVVRPALESGRHVVADRFADSTTAYQGGARGLGLETVEDLNASATEGLEPDLTLVILLQPETAVGRSAGDDRFESEGLDLQRTVAAAYRVIAGRHPERVVEIDGEGSVEEVHERVMRAVEERRGQVVGR
jgi:dTMP kinase